MTLTLVEPLVIEISADVAWTGNAFRHAVLYMRPVPGARGECVELQGR